MTALENGWMSKFTPSLPTSCSGLGAVQALINSDFWGITQKLDGHRLLITKGIESSSKGFNRAFEQREIPKHLSDQFNRFPGAWTFDGELIDNTYYIFDCLQYPGESLLRHPYHQRHELLRRVFEAGTWANMVCVPLHVEDKWEFFNYCRDNNFEGVVFKHLERPYGQNRTKNQYKYKFTHTIDCVIIDRGNEGKDNFTLGIYDGDKLIECGKVSALTGDGPSAKVGDVVEVTCLYTTQGSRLYQPVTPKLRSDKRPDECTIDQLHAALPNKSILIGDFSERTY